MFMFQKNSQIEFSNKISALNAESNDDEASA